MKLNSLAILTAVVALSLAVPCQTNQSQHPNPVATGITGNWEITLKSTTWTASPIPSASTSRKREAQSPV